MTKNLLFTPAQAVRTVVDPIQMGTVIRTSRRSAFVLFGNDPTNDPIFTFSRKTGKERNTPEGSTARIIVALTDEELDALKGITEATAEAKAPKAKAAKLTTEEAKARKAAADKAYRARKAAEKAEAAALAVA